MPYKDRADQASNERRWRERNREQDRAKHKRYYERNRLAVLERRSRRDAAKERARSRLRLAIAAGWIERPAENVEFHHPDYSRPYFGAWLDPSDHMRLHAGHPIGVECIDYSEAVALGRQALAASTARSLQQGRREAVAKAEAAAVAARSAPRSGYCQCGCGQVTPLAKQTRADRGDVRGEPIRFVRGHSLRPTIPAG